MGLAITVGILADLNEHDEEGAGWVRADLAAINKVLEAQGLPAHVENLSAGVPEMRSMGGFPYSFLHYLRRAYACQQSGQALRDGDLTEADDELIVDVSSDMSSHLLCHSDAEGWYVPIDFADPIFDEGIPGGEMLGSSQQLLREVLDLAPLLGIELVEGEPSNTARAAAEEADGEPPNWRARLVWHTVWEAAHLSVTKQLAISFG